MAVGVAVGVALGSGVGVEINVGVAVAVGDGVDVGVVVGVGVGGGRDDTFELAINASTERMSDGVPTCIKIESISSAQSTYPPGAILSQMKQPTQPIHSSAALRPTNQTLGLSGHITCVTNAGCDFNLWASVWTGRQRPLQVFHAPGCRVASCWQRFYSGE